MSRIKVWFPKFYTEYHRQPEQGRSLVNALKQCGIDCVEQFEPDCQLIFCGSVYQASTVRPIAANHPQLPVCHYNWDIYPFQVRGDAKDMWAAYLKDLKTAAEIWVPSYCTVFRTQEFTGRHAIVIKSCVRPWESSAGVRSGKYIVDVMRKYPDVNRHAVVLACMKLGIPCVETDCNLSWDKFKDVIAGARLLVSAYDEASTGGLTLLEGYYHGKPVLLSNSPRNGAVDYFGDRGTYFNYEDPSDLREKIEVLYNSPPQLDPLECAAWVSSLYSESRFARQIAERIHEVLSDVGSD